MARQYELMVIFIPSFDFSKESAVKEAIQAFVGNTVSVANLTIHGKKALTYEIKKHKDGVYVSCILEGKATIAEIENRAKLGTDVIRYLLTVKE
jgi:ribosomal protein S6